MIDENGFLISEKKARPKPKTELKSLLRSFVNVVYLSDDELLQIPAGSVFVFDVETYVNFFFIAFKDLKSGKFVTFEQSPASEINKAKLNWMLWRFCIASFNGNAYDIPMISLCLKGATCQQLKSASDYIIKSEVRITSFVFEKQFKLKIERYNHIDLIEVTPLQGSLKLYAGRLHCTRMQDLPFNESHILTAEDAEVVRPYCCNDLNNTELLFNELSPEIKLRSEMSEEYGVDLRSKSDAQIAESVINSELHKVLGSFPKRPILESGLILRYSVPSFIKYSCEKLDQILSTIENAEFELDSLGSPIMPKSIEKLSVALGSSVYKLGMGGLHSTESQIAHIAQAGEIIADNDVESFYPRIILNQRLFPAHLGEAFLQVYESIVNTRIKAKGEAAKAKKAGDKQGAKRWKIIADSLKITINGSFGKLGNKYSTLYAPQLMLQVTITGQLVLLMLIERLVSVGINVISGNTDGIISKYAKERHDEVRQAIHQWEVETGFKTEETRYSAVYSRDVNTYIAVKTESGDPEARFLDERLGCKTKGAFSERGSALNSVLSKNPETLVCIDAVLDFIKNKTPIETTIKSCTNIRRFISVKNVKGGGEKNGVFLGKVVRWYYPKNEAGCINYVISGNKVAKSDGARPLMDLPEAFPSDVDYSRYISIAFEMLFDCGALVKPATKQLKFF